MKKLALILMAAAVCVACNKTAEKQQPPPAEEVVVVEEAVAEVPEAVEEEIAPEDIPQRVQMPEFPGGMDELMKYLSDNIQYPSKAKENKWEGTVLCELVVEKDGSINEAKVLKSSGYQLLDIEALRVVLNMPKWTAGKQDGDSVRVQFALPISFKLQ